MTSLAASITPQAAAFPGALVRLCRRAQGELWGLRLGRLYGFGIGASYALLAWFGPVSVGGSVKLWARCLATASWVAGVGALSLATDLAARDATQGLTALTRLRGFSEAQLERARSLAGAQRLATNVLVPALILTVALLFRFRTLQASVVALWLLPLSAVYAALVGVTLSRLARACSRWLPGRGRLLLLGIALGPWLLGIGLHAKVPNIPGALGWLLQRMAGSFN
ncbi:MAG TPA: hypothetical protein VNG33_15490 [Polyangiaceae bacterium]|nr:hypothetical protein [Polyangiaceae bacterium]